MRSAEVIIKGNTYYIKEFGVPDYLADIVPTKDVIKLINEARKECLEELIKKAYLESPDSYIIKKSTITELIDELK